MYRHHTIKECTLQHFLKCSHCPKEDILSILRGVKGFGTIDFEPEEVAHFFPAVFKISHDCRFNNCTHRHEPGCAVLAAVEVNTGSADPDMQAI